MLRGVPRAGPAEAFPRRPTSPASPGADVAFGVVTLSVEAVFFLKSALAHADVCIVHNDWPRWRDLTAADFAGMRRSVVVDGRRISQRGALQGVELHVLGGYSGPQAGWARAGARRGM